jgi:hypothetical protein
LRVNSDDLGPGGRKGRGNLKKLKFKNKNEKLRNAFCEIFIY